MILTMKNLEQSAQFIQQQTSKILSSLIQEFDTYFHLNLTELKKENNPVFVLHHFFSVHQIKSSTINTILSNPKNGSKFLIGDNTYYYHNEKLIWQKNFASYCTTIQENDLNTKIELPQSKYLKANVVVDSTSISHDNKNTIYLNFRNLKFPLKLRFWNDGDIFQPYGMGGKQKKIQDLFSDLKFNPIEKKHIPIVTDRDNKILWVVGIRRATHAPIKVDTKTILKLRIS